MCMVFVGELDVAYCVPGLATDRKYGWLEQLLILNNDRFSVHFIEIFNWLYLESIGILFLWILFCNNLLSVLSHGAKLHNSVIKSFRS